MKYYTITVNGEDVNLRLKSSDIVELEKKYNKDIQTIITEITFEKAITLLRYMRKATLPQYSFSEAQAFTDDLVDNGYSLETIFTNIIFPCCAESGIMTKVDLERMMDAITKQHNKENEELQTSPKQ